MYDSFDNILAFKIHGSYVREIQETIIIKMIIQAHSRIYNIASFRLLYDTCVHLFDIVVEQVTQLAQEIFSPNKLESKRVNGVEVNTAELVGQFQVMNYCLLSFGTK